MVDRSCVAHAGLLTAVSCGVAMAGCASSITAPLPAFKPFVSAMSADENKQAITALVKKGESHQQEAEEQIAQSR